MIQSLKTTKSEVYWPCETLIYCVKTVEISFYGKFLFKPERVIIVFTFCDKRKYVLFNNYLFFIIWFLIFL